MTTDMIMADARAIADSELADGEIKPEEYDARVRWLCGELEIYYEKH